MKILLTIVLIISFLSVWNKPVVLGDQACSLNTQTIFTGINKQRVNLGLTELTPDQRLTDLALMRANDLQTTGEWSHEGFREVYDDIIFETHYEAGEILAKKWCNSDEVITAWMNSPTHKEVIVNPVYENLAVVISGDIVVGFFQGDKVVKEVVKENKIIIDPCSR